MNPRREDLQILTRQTGQGSGYKTVLVLTLLFTLVSVFVSVGLVVYTAWNHDIKNGLFALAFSVLSTKMAFSWLLWQEDEGEAASSK